MTALLINALFHAVSATLMSLGLCVLLATYQSRRNPAAARFWIEIARQLFGE